MLHVCEMFKTKSYLHPNYDNWPSFHRTSTNIGWLEKFDTVRLGNDLRRSVSTLALNRHKTFFSLAEKLTSNKTICARIINRSDIIAPLPAGTSSFVHTQRIRWEVITAKILKLSFCKKNYALTYYYIQLRRNDSKPQMLVKLKKRERVISV